MRSRPLIQILLANGPRLMRQGLRALLEKHGAVGSVSEAEGRDILCTEASLPPNVIILDVGLIAGPYGPALVGDIRRRFPACGLLAVSWHSRVEEASLVLQCGADGYLSLTASLDTLIEAVEAVSVGRRYLCPSIPSAALRDYRQHQSSHPTPGTLTNREREVLMLAAEGFSNPKIAHQLGISPRTAENHRARGMKKLGLSHPVEFLRYAVTHGMISLG